MILYTKKVEEELGVKYKERKRKGKAVVKMILSILVGRGAGDPLERKQINHP